jgi:hypothetical protein
MKMSKAKRICWLKENRETQENGEDKSGAKPAWCFEKEISN